ncbi:MAG: hypothetical protein ABW080_14345 [Candidatus Thiodiazotropha sp.]
MHQFAKYIQILGKGRKGMRSLTQDEAEDSYGEAAVIGTLAMVIKALGVEASEQSAHRLATLWWHERQQCDNSREAVVS